MFIDLTGKKFNKLTVIGIAYITDRHRIYWKCKCDCGNECVIRGDSIKNGHAKSCGCNIIESLKTKPRNYKHGQKDTRLYTIWGDMYSRCYNENDPNYKRYGARGIHMCNEWRDFRNFYEWAMNAGYRDDLSIDRIDNYKGYCPENCRWATRKEQANNKTTNRIYEINGERLNIGQIAEKYNIDYQLVWGRLKKGWSIEKAILPKMR